MRLASLDCPALVEACPNEGFTAQLKAFDEELRIGVLGGFSCKRIVPLEVSNYINGLQMGYFTYLSMGYTGVITHLLTNL